MTEEPKTMVGRGVREGPLVFGPYVTEELIGAGGFGTVYRARGSDGAIVALKVLVPYVADADMIRRFQREAKIRIEHPNVVRVLDAGTTEEDRHYIAFELLEGEALGERLRAAPLPVSEVVDLGLQICEGLTAAHRNGIIHRDLKPGNVFICNDGTVKLLDFGIARAQTEDTMMQLTMEGSVVGTPGYLAPEQAKGVGEIDLRADLWALGVILYQALTGVSPFLRDSSIATILAVVLEEPTALASRVDGLPPGLAELVHRCLRKEAAQRFDSAPQVAQALRRVDPSAGASKPAPVDPRALAKSLPNDEQRVVALLLAAGVEDQARLTAAVEEYGGQLIPMLAGRAIGVFGGRTWEGDETSHALRAAVEARDAVAWIAVASGRASGAGGIVSGDALRAVERACDARRDGVAIDSVAARSLTGFALEEVGSGLYELPRDVDLRGTQVPDVRGRHLPLLGRNAEVAQLGAAVSMALDERRAVAVWVSGPPGIGKTRLRSVLLSKLAEHGGDPMVWVGRAESHRREAALHLLAAAIRHAALSDVPGTPAEQKTALEAFCARAVGDAAWGAECAQTISRLLGPSPDTQRSLARVSDPQLMSDKLRLALGDVITGLAQRGPLAIVLDDVQWSDAASLELLEELLTRASELPLLVFVAARPELMERHPDLFAGSDVVRIQPRGLVASQVRSLATAIAERALREELVRTITERTGGNPFFVEQIVRELVESQLLDSEIEQLPIPLTVEGAVQSRLDHLPPPEKQLCKRAAVLGRTFTPSGLAALGVQDATPLLTALGRRGLVGVRGRAQSAPEREYQFQSTLVCDVAYRMNPESARAEVHKRAAEYLAAQAHADPEEVAMHFERGGASESAAAYWAQGAITASRRGDSNSIVRCVDHADALGAPTDMSFELRIARADAMSFLGNREEQERDLERALDLASNPIQRARALTEQVALLAGLGNHDRGTKVAAEAVEVARGCDDADVLATALARQCWVLLYSGQVAEAEAAVLEASGLEASIRPDTSALVAAWRAQLATAEGDLGRRRKAYADAIARYRELGDVRRAATAEVNLADTYNRVGGYDLAERALRESLRSNRRLGHRTMEGFAQVNLGYALAMQGRTDEALDVLAEAERAAVEVGQPRLGIAARVYRARAILQARPSDQAVSDAESAADEARRAGMPALCASALAMAARARLETGDAAMALALSRRAIQLRDELGSLEEDEGEVFLTHACALQANGLGEETEKIVRKGATRLRELAGRIRDLDWRTRFVTDVIANRQLLEMDQALDARG